MVSDRVTKKTLEILGGIGSILMGLACAGLSVFDAQNNRSMSVVWIGMSVLLVVNGIAMQLHARKRDDSPLLPGGLPLGTPSNHAKARS
jgi:hypothetical protein